MIESYRLGAEKLAPSSHRIHFYTIIILTSVFVGSMELKSTETDLTTDTTTTIFIFFSAATITTTVA